MANFSTNIDFAVQACERYESIAADLDGYERINLLLDLRAADGENGNSPLDWDRLLAADDFNFLHDICGISQHMDRVTGVIGGFFRPRFAMSSAA